MRGEVNHLDTTLPGFLESARTAFRAEQQLHLCAVDRDAGTAPRSPAPRRRHCAVLEIPAPPSRRRSSVSRSPARRSPVSGVARASAVARASNSEPIITIDRLAARRRVRSGAALSPAKGTAATLSFGDDFEGRRTAVRSAPAGSSAVDRRERRCRGAVCRCREPPQPAPPRRRRWPPASRRARWREFPTRRAPTDRRARFRAHTTVA